jgi:cytochrome c oxidase assembly factor CtaG
MNPDAAWTFDPAVLIAVGAFAAVYVTRWRQARIPDEPHPPSVGRLVLFLSGLVAVLIALVSPVDRLGEQLMFMHMVQHVLLLDLAPILLILGLTKVLLRPATRRVHAVEQRAGWLAHPAFAVILYVAVMWVWHIPAMYDLALQHSGIHVLEHLCFVAAGTLYWWHLLSPIRSRMRLGGMGPIGYMVSTKLFVGLLGIGLAFAPTSLYAFYSHLPHYWGLSPTEDQNMAGLVMALEQSVVMGVALVVLFVQMLNEAERKAQRAERYEVEPYEIGPA